MKRIKTLTAAIVLSVAACPAISQELVDLPTSELVAEIVYLKGFLQPLDLSSPDRRAIQIAFTQVAVCAEMDVDDFRALGATIDHLLEPVSDSPIFSSVSPQTYSSYEADGCGVQSDLAQSAANFVTPFNGQLNVLAQIERRQQILNERVFSEVTPTPLDGLLKVLALSFAE